MIARWLQALKRFWTGDDGRQWGVITEPSMFRLDESRVEGPFTRRAALRCARRFVRRNPFGEARAFARPAGSAWPPETNRE